MKVFISTIGKVGSTSLLYGFRQAGFNVFPDNAESIVDLIKNKPDSVVHTHKINFTRYAIDKAVACNHECLVFVGARDMLKRHISTFFQNIENPNNRFWYLPNWESLSTGELHKEFEERVLIHIEDRAEDWFLRFAEKNSIPESMINQKLEEVRLEGITRLNPPIYGERVTFVFYQLEKLDSNWLKVKDYAQSSRFPSLPLRVNVANTLRRSPLLGKNISPAYKNFLHTYIPSPLVLEKSYNCDLARFYTQEEIERQIKAWLVK